MFGSVVLGRAECETLLGSGAVGRVALATPTGPHLVAVRYVLLEGSILVRTSPYGPLGTHGRNALLAFEVDDFDAMAQGWSVVVKGRARVVTDAARLARITAAWWPAATSTPGRRLTLALPAGDIVGSRSGAA